MRDANAATAKAVVLAVEDVIEEGFL